MEEVNGVHLCIEVIFGLGELKVYSVLETQFLGVELITKVWINHETERKYKWQINIAFISRMSGERPCIGIVWMITDAAFPELVNPYNPIILMFWIMDVVYMLEFANGSVVRAGKRWRMKNAHLECAEGMSTKMSWLNFLIWRIELQGLYVMPVHIKLLWDPRVL